MRRMDRLPLLAALAPLLMGAATFEVVSPSYRGRGEFILVGASMTDNAGLQNGVNCLKSSASAIVFPNDLPARPRLVRATLYIGGSLLDDGPDYSNITIFDGEGRNADAERCDGVPPDDCSALAQDVAMLELAARQAADTSVQLLLPGAPAPITVSGTTSYVDVLYKSSGPEQGNLGFFITPIDVTDELQTLGEDLAGAYEVRDLRADVCLGLDVACTPGGLTCDSQPGSDLHTNGAASFALLLVFEDPSLPLRSITTFEGLRSIAGASLTETLQLSSPVSDPTSGSLAFYALEGDLTLPTGAVTAGPCGADEFIEVDGDDDPSSDGVCLNDDDNPVQNVFNASINVQPETSTDLLCNPATDPSWMCCSGDGLCGVVGVDIDRFNISSALTPGERDLRVTVGSGQDRIYMAAMLVGVEIFEPILDVDTQIRVLTADDAGNVQMGGPIVYSIAVSNTGNVDADEVQVVMDMPAFLTDFEVLVVPAGATDQSQPLAGAAGTGEVRVVDFTVPAGEIAEIRVRATTPCRLDATLAPEAHVTALGVPTFDVPAPVVTLRGPGIPGSGCEELDPEGPFSPTASLPPRVLRGSGGCAATSGPLVALGLLLLWAVRTRRRS